MASAPPPASADPIDADLQRLLTSFDTHYVWRYGPVRPELRALYEKAKAEQWNGSTALDWSTPVEPESDIVPAAMSPLAGFDAYERMAPDERAHARHAMLAWQLSQFLHGEQGALLTASQLVGAVPWMDAKHYASTQTLDEARHVEVFGRYLNEKLEWELPIDETLKRLLDTILLDERWDLKYLGMQVLVEGLAMAAFGNVVQLAQEPLLRRLVQLVMRDEARHVAFGVLSLRGYYGELPEVERREREDFVIEACVLMRDRLVGDAVADVLGFDRAALREHMLQAPLLQMFRQGLFSRVVPNVKRLGLLTPRVREAFDGLGVIGFEDCDPEAADLALGL